VLFLTGPGDDRQAVLDGIRAIGDEGRAQGVPVVLEPIQREFMGFWSTSARSARRGARGRGGRRTSA
jgi:hypothetical protein